MNLDDVIDEDNSENDINENNLFLNFKNMTLNPDKINSKTEFEYFSIKDYVIFAIDCFSENFYEVLKISESFVKNKIISSQDDYFGIIFYNYYLSNNEYLIEGISNIIKLNIVSLDLIKDIKALYNSLKIDHSNFILKTNYSSRSFYFASDKECSINDVFWIAHNELNKYKINNEHKQQKRIFLFTDNDNPMNISSNVNFEQNKFFEYFNNNIRSIISNKSNNDIQNKLNNKRALNYKEEKIKTIQQSKDLEEQNIKIELFPLAKGFNIDIFYYSILFFSSEEEKLQLKFELEENFINRLSDICKRFRLKETKKRCLGKLEFFITNELSIFVDVYCLINKAKKTKLINVHQDNLKIIKTFNKYIELQSGKDLLKNETGTYYEYAGLKIPFLKNEFLNKINSVNYFKEKTIILKNTNKNSFKKESLINRVKNTMIDYSFEITKSQPKKLDLMNEHSLDYKTTGIKEELSKCLEYNSNLNYDFNPNIKLIGFKSIKSIKPYHTIGKGYFIYPNESLASNSSNLVDALIKAMVYKKLYGIVLFTPKLGNKIRYYLLQPQLESFDENLFQTPAGFHITPIAYAEEIRLNDDIKTIAKNKLNYIKIASNNLDINKTTDMLKSTSKMSNENKEDKKIINNDKEINVFNSLIKNMTIQNFSVRNFENYYLQKFYAYLEAIALNEPQVSNVEDNLTTIDDCFNDRILDMSCKIKETYNLNKEHKTIKLLKKKSTDNNTKNTKTLKKARKNNKTYSTANTSNISHENTEFTDNLLSNNLTEDNPSYFTDNNLLLYYKENNLKKIKVEVLKKICSLRSINYKNLKKQELIKKLQEYLENK